MRSQLYYVYDRRGEYLCEVWAISPGGAIQSAINDGYFSAYSTVLAEARNR